ncbi:MAG: DUF4919 domain-containing protein [Bacteroidales bacterium]|nr:DUF4919 domain-containing protein [Bacteroidales bacterium]
MKKLFFATLMFLTPCLCLAQSEEGEDIIVEEVGQFSYEAPHYEAIKQAIADTNSDYYYPKLLERLAKADTTLAEDINTMRCIYYGYVFQPNFNPYKHFDEQKEIGNILFGDEEPTKADFLKVIELADKVIAQKPTELPMYYYRLIGCAYGYGEDDPRTLDARFRLDMLFSAIYSSGTGSREAPFHVSSVMHSYFIMDMNDLHPQHQALIFVNGRACDAFPLQENEVGLDTLFFDVTECMHFWDQSFESSNEATEEEAGTKLELPLGTHFIIKLEEDLDEEDTEFKVVKMEPFDKVIDRYDNNYLFSEEGEPGTIEGYFCRSTYGNTVEEIRDNVKIVLVFKSWIDGMLNYDTYIRQENGTWEETSNSGIWHKVLMTEIWSTGYDMLRISNLRKMTE